MIFKEGDILGARERMEKALAIQDETGDTSFAASTRRALATVLIEEGQAASAETLARESTEHYRTEKVGVSEGRSRSVLAESLLAQGKLAEAQISSAAASKLVAKSDDRSYRLSVQTTDARVRAASGDSTRAAKSLDAILAEATRFHLIEEELGARLALGEVEMTSGKATAGRARLAALERDATAKGFLLVARKARAAASRTP